TLTEAAAALPQMNGSGMVRNLRAAMSQAGAAADELEAAVVAFAAASTRDAQLAQVDAVITEWAQTSGYWSDLETTLGGAVTLTPPEGMSKAEYRKLVAVLEAFNGSRFYGAVGQFMPLGQTASEVDGTTHYAIAPQPQQVVLLQQAYAALRESVYDALVVQTRLKPYLDAVELVVDEHGVSFDTTAMNALLQSRYATEPQHAIEDLVELNLLADAQLRLVGFDPVAPLRAWVDALPANDPLHAVFARMNVLGAAASEGSDQSDIYLGNAGANSFSGGAGNDTLDGGAGGDVLNGGAGQDRLNGGADNDTLQGNAGDDTLHGGTGNDVLIGGTHDGYWNTYAGAGNDTYQFDLGDGQDTIYDHDGTAGNRDKLVFGSGIRPQDVTLVRTANLDLVLKINGSTDQVTADQVTINGYFIGDAGSWQIEEIQFKDAPNTVWSAADVKRMMFTGGAGNDTIMGYASDDELFGLEGSDSLSGEEGNDTLHGGAGGDVLKGGDGNDRLNGGADNDILQGNAGDDTLHGGTGNDVLIGGTHDGYWNTYAGAGNDTYLFDLGDGQDTIYDNTTAAGYLDRLVFGSGIRPQDVTLVRTANQDLVLKISGSEDQATTDQVTINGYFIEGAAGSWQIEEIHFTGSPDTVWSVADVNRMMLTGGVGNDTIVGYASDDELFGREGSDSLSGEDGNDTLHGGAGGDVLKGGDGHDRLNGGADNDYLQGNAGDDTLHGGTGNDVLIGGTHDGYWNTFRGAGSDTYLFDLGDGQDTVYDHDISAGNLDKLVFGSGIRSQDVTLVRTAEQNLVLKINGTTDQVTITSYFHDDADGPGVGAGQIEEIRFDDGTSWDFTHVKAMAQPQAAGRKAAMGSNTDPSASALTVEALAGSPGAPRVEAQQEPAVDDTHSGSSGHDKRVNMFGGQTFVFGRGDGQETINNIADSWNGTEAPAAGNRDLLQFKPGLTARDVALRRSGDDLIAQIKGSTDQITAQNYFHGGSDRSHTLKAIRFHDDTGWYFPTIRDLVTERGLDAAKLAGPVNIVPWEDILEKPMHKPIATQVPRDHPANEAAERFWQSLVKASNGDPFGHVGASDTRSTGIARLPTLLERQQMMPPAPNELTAKLYAKADAWMLAMANQPSAAETSFTPLQSSEIFPMISASLN
ncbi:calcium-binding protein, partial [Hydrogenophaga sp.]|uniref:calcium-binding protein n=1 Tax=Hydrogenophaga sp. TaxID=1904254 RepID=UPI0027160EC3